MRQVDFAQLRNQTQERMSLFSPRENELKQLVDELTAIFSEAEEVLKQHQDSDRSLIACGAGCQDCCVVNVSITLLEGIAIAQFLRSLDSVNFKSISTRLDLLWRDVRGLDDDERMVLRRQCAFLDERGYCLIYPVRPLFCRSVTSTDVEHCRAAVSGQVFGEVQPVMMHQFQLQLYKTLFSGVADGLERAGLDGRSFQLCGLVRYLLSYPDRDEELLTRSSLCWDEIYT